MSLNTNNLKIGQKLIEKSSGLIFVINELTDYDMYIENVNPSHLGHDTEYHPDTIVSLEHIKSFELLPSNEQELSDKICKIAEKILDYWGTSDYGIGYDSHGFYQLNDEWHLDERIISWDKTNYEFEFIPVDGNWPLQIIIELMPYLNELKKIWMVKENRD